MKTAFLFDGQCVQRVGMGRDIYYHSAETMNISDTISQAVGFNVIDVALNGSAEDILEKIWEQAAGFHWATCTQLRQPGDIDFQE